MRIMIVVRSAYLGSAMRRIVHDSVEFGLINFYNDIDTNLRKIMRSQFLNIQENAYERPVTIAELHGYLVVYCSCNVIAILLFVFEIIHFKLTKK